MKIVKKLLISIFIPVLLLTGCGESAKTWYVNSDNYNNNYHYLFDNLKLNGINYNLLVILSDSDSIQEMLDEVKLINKNNLINKKIYIVIVYNKTNINTAVKQAYIKVNSIYKYLLQLNVANLKQNVSIINIPVVDKLIINYKILIFISK